MQATRDLVLLGMPGSLRAGSYNCAALRFAAGVTAQGAKHRPIAKRLQALAHSTRRPKGSSSS